MNRVVEIDLRAIVRRLNASIYSKNSIISDLMAFKYIVSDNIKTRRSAIWWLRFDIEPLAHDVVGCRVYNYFIVANSIRIIKLYAMIVTGLAATSGCHSNIMCVCAGVSSYHLGWMHNGLAIIKRNTIHSNTKLFIAYRQCFDVLSSCFVLPLAAQVDQSTPL